MTDPSDNRWLERIRKYYRVQNILLLCPDVPLWIVQWDGDKRLQWWELTDPRRRILPFHFEIFFGKEERRDDYYRRVLARTRQTRAFTTDELFGFTDAFYPLPVDPQGLTFLYAGQFSSALLDWEGVARRWTELTSQSPAGANPDFVRFVRMALSLPVLDAGAIRALQAFFEMYADALGTGMDSDGLEARAESVKHQLLEHLPDTSWVEQAVSADKFERTPWQHEGELAEWMVRQLGICRIPTTAMALMPLTDRGERVDVVEAMVRTYRIQHECVRYVAELPETGAARLQDYGVTFLTSTAPGKSSARTRLELRERGLRLRAMVRERFGVDSVVGIGRTQPPFEPLQPSHHEAVVALHLCVQLEKELLFYSDKYNPSGELRYTHLHEAAAKLSDAFSRVSVAETKVASDFYVRLVLLYSGERIEVLRGQFLAMLFQLIGNVQKRHVLGDNILARFSDELSATLESANSVAAVIDGFKEALQRLSFFSSRALEGPKSIRLGATLQYLKDNFAEPLRLPDVARKAGFSVPAFSRIFRQATGTSFLAYLRNVRIEHARLLLRTTPLSAEQIAQACGFQSQHHLIRSFKKVTGQTPGTYRKVASVRKSASASNVD